jgi:predicted MFS family arabinose efflux permease
MTTDHPLLSRRSAITVFLAFASAYFLSTLIRAITATLSPTLTVEMGLNARDLGLLAGGYFLGFSFTQLPLGSWLDRFGPKKVNLAFLAVAVLGCLAFATATSFIGLLAARMLCGVGLSACLMAPLTGYRRWFDATSQLRTNSWMLMTGSLGMLMSTLPVQWLMPLFGWRALFVGLAVFVVLTMLLIVWLVPAWQSTSRATDSETSDADTGYSEIWRSRYFWRMTPVGFFSYGGMVAIQTLWAGPWLTQVGGWTSIEAATGLFGINLTMLLTFWTWGLITPKLARRGIHPNALITWGVPLSMGVMCLLIIGADQWAEWTAVVLALFCLTSSFVSLAQPAVGQAFPAALAGRALSAYNLVIFAGIFVVQWGIGLAVDLFKSMGWGTLASFQAAMTGFLVCSVMSYGYFLWAKPDNQQP